MLVLMEDAAKAVAPVPAQPVGCQNGVMCSDLKYLDHLRAALVPDVSG